MGREVSRHEIKYVVSLREAELLKYRLPSLMRRDPYALADGSYFIRSLYFDDLDYTAYHEKVDGVEKRIKYRIRFYNNNPSVIYLEKKTKDGDLTGKDSVSLSRELTERLSFAPEGLPVGNGLLGEFTALRLSGHRPACLVDYDRWAFIWPDGNVRVTIDMNVRTAPWSTELFRSDLLTVPVLDDGEAVLEVKYDDFLPAPVRALVEGVPRQRCAVSKYTRCLGILE